MKTKIIYALSALMMVAMMLVTSCSEDGDGLTPTPPITIPTEFTSLSLESDAIDKEVKFVATTGWSVTLEETTKAAPSWLKVSPMSGDAGGVTLNVEVEENTVEKERSSNVTISAGGEQYTIAVKQKAGVQKTVAVTGVALNEPTLSLVAGTTETLTATIAPENATNKNVTWNSSNTAVATVVDGVVAAVAVGNAIITVTTDDGTKTATCAVTVTTSVVAVTGVTVTPTLVSLFVGGTTALTATVAPADATNKNVTWSSSNTAVATVENGVVKAIAEGSAVITATTEDGTKTDTCAVTVKEAITIIPVAGVTLAPTSITLQEGAVKTLTETVAPANANNKGVTWSSSNTAVATVVDGVVTAVAAGNATITVTTKDGSKTATCAVTVTDKTAPTVAVTGVTVDPTSATIYVGGTKIITATVAPSNATNQNVTWSSSNTAVATVENGVIKAVAVGDAIITATTEDGTKTATCTVKVSKLIVIAPVTGVTLDPTSVTFEEGASKTLTETVAPANANNKGVTWSSSNTAVATVVDGVVTAVAAGNATITVTTKDGSKTATCAVTVTDKTAPTVAVTGVTVDPTSATIYVGGTKTITATVAPSNATNQNVTWSSSNIAVATVENGVIKAVAVGDAIITATTEDGTKTATCTVKVSKLIVIAPVTGVTLDPTSVTLEEGASKTLTETVAPANANNKGVTWSSSNTAVATVVDGVVTAVAVGNATITVTTKDGSKTATCKVTVSTRTGTTPTPPDIIGGEL